MLIIFRCFMDVFIRVHSISVYYYDSLYVYSELGVIKTYRHYGKDSRGWNNNVDVIQARHIH